MEQSYFLFTDIGDLRTIINSKACQYLYAGKKKRNQDSLASTLRAFFNFD